MKNIIIKLVFIVFCVMCQLVNAQNHVTVKSILIGSNPDKSYLISLEGRIFSMTTTGVRIAGSISPFFLKVNPERPGGPSSSENFVREESYYVPVLNDQQIQELKSDLRSITTQYFNGLGTLSQAVAVKSTPQKWDFISFHKYDEFGREPKVFLPFASNSNGAYRANAASEQLTFYSAGQNVVKDAEPFATQEFDQSPMNRLKKSLSPGWKWHSDAESIGVVRSYKVNTATEVYRIQENAGIPIFSTTDFYPANTLQVTETRDEKGLTTRSYVDFNNRLILERKGDATVTHDIYYVYDIKGNLSVVFPPEASARLNVYATSDKAKFLDKWCFQYRYDGFRRNTKKKIPGGDWTVMYYDKWDRLVLQQDANLRKSSQWTYTKYDIHNRPIMSGLISGDEATLVSSLNASNTRCESRANNSFGYTNLTFPAHTSTNLQTITYYDCYNFLGYNGWNTDNANLDPVSDNNLVDLTRIFRPGDITLVYAPVVRGRVTAKRTKILGHDKWLTSVFYYDQNYNMVQRVGTNHLSKIDRESFVYHDLSSKMLKARRTISGVTGILVTNEEFEYDHAWRVLKRYHQINDQPKIVLASYRYNELGQLIEKNIHSTDGYNFIQSVDHRYNIQGWLTSINNSTLSSDGAKNDDTNDLFGLEILYNESQTFPNQNYTTKKYYDGNVSALKWMSKIPGTANVEKAYGFNYDVFSRFRQSYFAVNTSTGFNASAGMFNEAILYYDRNGNIGGNSQTSVSLTRNGMVGNTLTQVDQLTYRYEGNQLKNVRDNTARSQGFADKPGVDLSFNEMNYDGNGNLIGDDNKSITRISYNHLNFPQEIEMLTPVTGGFRTDKVVYVYDAKGSKLKKEVFVGGSKVWSTDYLGEVQYDNGIASYVSTPEGRAVNNGVSFDYEYFHRDHQNNVRVVYGLHRQTNAFKATMETANDNLERNTYGFRNITETRTLGNNYTAADPVVSAPDKSARCNSYSDGTVPIRPIGPAKSLQVSANDIVYAEVYARFNATKNISTVIAATTLAGAVTSTFGVTSTESPKLWQGLNAIVPTAASSLSASGSVPKAYIVMLYFDSNYNFIRASLKSISERAYGSFEKLTVSMKPEQNGYVYVYVANETGVSFATDVFFDDLYIIHQKGNPMLQVIQASDYYPLGIPFNQFNADKLRATGSGYEPVVRNRMLFQGQEYERDLGLAWYHYRYRMHDPAIGRFGVLDPLAEDYKHNSPYAFSENQLTQGIELEGLESKKLFETMKYFSPVAWNWNVSHTTHETKVGLEVSIGLPKMMPFSFRKGFGISANLHDIIQQKFVPEARSSTETSYLGLASFQSTKYLSGETSQTTGAVTFGGPLLNIQYENDWFPSTAMNYLDPFRIHPTFGGDGGDRFRTAAMQLNVGLLNGGFKLATGDPGFPRKSPPNYFLGGRAGTYEPATLDGIYFDPDKYRLGLGYVAAGPFGIGINHENIRHQIQNLWTHDNLHPPSPWFQYLPSTAEFYFGFNTGTSTQW